MTSRRCLAMLLAALALASCAPSQSDAYVLAMAEGHRAHHAGRYDEALSAYERAAASAERVKDRDEARFLAARTLQRAERWPEAAAAYQRLAAASPSGPRTPRAEFDFADLTIEHGDAAEGWRLLEHAAKRHASHGLARHAIRRLAARAGEQGGYAAALSWLDGARKTFEATDLAQTVEYERALALDRLGRRQEARDAFVRTARAKPYPFGALWDDSLWRAAEIERELGRPQGAIELLREILAARESPSHTVGSYERPRFSQARMRIAEILRDDLRDAPAARAEFHRVYADHTTSILRDDALWEEARLAKAAGDADDACRLVRAIVEDLPDSRFVPCVRDVCPKAESPSKRECPDYIRRGAE